MLSFSQAIFKNLIFPFFFCTSVLIVPIKSHAETLEIGIIVSKKLNVRSSYKQSAKIIKILKKGTKVKVLRHHKGWVKILHEGTTGYIRNRKKYVIITKVEQKRKKGNIVKINAKAAEVDKKIKEQKKKVEGYTQKQLKIINGLDQIDFSLDKFRKSIKNLKKELNDIYKKIEKNNLIYQKLLKEIKLTETYASKRLVALYKINKIGKIHILTSADSIFDFIKRKTAIEKILISDAKMLEELLLNKIKLQDLQVELNKQKKQKISLESTYKDQVRLMKIEKAKRKKLLADINQKKSLGLAVIESLKRVANELDEKIKTLNMEVSKKTSNNISLTKNCDKGSLEMPVTGNIVSYFGKKKNKKLNIVTFKSGIDIVSDRGEPVKAVCPGTVLYAKWFKGYGNMIIINHGKNYYTLYAHAEELFKSKGDFVEAREVIATVGDSGSMDGRPMLHFEVRHHDKPVDPIKWLNKGE